MATDYVITTRVIRNSQFTAEPGPVRFLRVPRSAQAFDPSHAVSGAGDLKAWVDEVIATHPDEVAAYRGGKQGLLGFFTGQVMQRSGGSANPKAVGDLLRSRLG